MTPPNCRDLTDFRICGAKLSIRLATVLLVSPFQKLKNFPPRSRFFFVKRDFDFFRRFCERNGIVMIAYSPFGSPDLPWGEKMPHILVDPVLKRIAHKYQRSTAQIVVRWLLQRGLATIPKVYMMNISFG